MFAKLLCLIGLLSCLIASSLAQRQWPETAEAFPATEALPDLFTFKDGSKVESRKDWKRRRGELIALLMHYQYGSVPPKPDLVAAKIGRVREHASGLGTVNELTLLIGKYAQDYYLADDFGNLTERVRHWRDAPVATLPLPHPSPRNQLWLKKNPWFTEEVLPQLGANVSQLLAG